MRKLMTVLTAMLCATVLAGCSSGGGPGGSKGTAPKSDTTRYTDAVSGLSFSLPGPRVKVNKMDDAALPTDVTKSTEARLWTATLPNTTQATITVGVFDWPSEVTLADAYKPLVGQIAQVPGHTLVKTTGTMLGGHQYVQGVATYKTTVENYAKARLFRIDADHMVRVMASSGLADKATASAAFDQVIASLSLGTPAPTTSTTSSSTIAPSPTDAPTAESTTPKPMITLSPGRPGLR